MKTKRNFYLAFIVLGAVIVGFGEAVIVEEEYALSIGIVIFMFGLYKTTQLLSSEQFKDKEESKKNNE